METYGTIVSFFQDGGIFMYPIMIVLTVGASIAIERYLFLSRSTSVNRRVWNELMPLVKSGDYKKAYALTSESKAAIGKILNYGLSRTGVARRRDDVETAMEEGLMEVVPSLEKRTHYIATFANIATLLGLLGTIIGLIKAFTAVSHADPAEKADLLSASISVAMNTTAFGLMVAIPLLLIYSVLQSKTTTLVDSLEMASVKFINMLTEQKKTGEPA
ncbi:MAG: MotA/TolQ/ExbB proton channel family protein [Acidiferrobacterales bacterium]